jgi:hypothetical protein
MTEDKLPALVDVGAVLSHKTSRNMAKDLDRMLERYPELAPKFRQVHFAGRGGHRATWVPRDVPALVEFVFLLPGRAAAVVRRAAAESFVTLYGEDLRIIGQIEQIGHVQEALLQDGDAGVAVVSTTEIVPQAPSRALVIRTARIARRSVVLAVRKYHLKAKQDLKSSQDMVLRTVAQQREQLLLEFETRLGRATSEQQSFFLQCFEGLRNAIMTPTSAFIGALRQAVKAPASRRTIDPRSYPPDQQATREDVCLSTSLMLALFKALMPEMRLTYGAWKAVRNLFGRRALQLRLQDHEEGLCARPRLWAHGGPADNCGVRYIFSGEEAEKCVRRILAQSYQRTVVAEHVRQVIASTEPGEWPANDVDIEPEWHHSS